MLLRLDLIVYVMDMRRRNLARACQNRFQGLANGWRNLKLGGAGQTKFDALVNGSEDTELVMADQTRFGGLVMPRRILIP